MLDFKRKFLFYGYVIDCTGEKLNSFGEHKVEKKCSILKSVL